MQETTTRPIDGNGHMPFDVRDDPDRERWAAYWQEMRREAIGHLGDAFDMVAKRLEAGDARAAADVVVFCADESNGRRGIIGAICDLLLTTYTAHQIASEVEAGCALGDLVPMVTP